ncbi:hypothetical protein KY345_05540 [Candidatus Woesearchaeota archaeon]|nr:hypothetical protein [Candidatus Woesearchaeota archaeon]
MNRKAIGTNELSVILIVINIVLLVSVIIVGLSLRKEEVEEEEFIFEGFEVGEQKLIDPQFKVKEEPLSADVKLCNSIDENFNCDESNTFGFGSDIYVLFSVSGFQQADTDQGWLTGIRGDIKAINSDGEVIEQINGLLFNFAEYTQTRQSSVKLKEKISTFLKIDIPGEYIFEFEITDRISGEKITKRVNLEILK